MHIMSRPTEKTWEEQQGWDDSLARDLERAMCIDKKYAWPTLFYLEDSHYQSHGFG